MKRYTAFLLVGMCLLFTNFLFFNATTSEKPLVFSNHTLYGESSSLLAAQLGEVLDSALKQNCYGDGTIKGPASYNCGEYPVGKIIDKNTKQLTAVSLKKGLDLVKIKDGSVKLKSDFNLSVNMDRTQKQNYAQASLLDVKGVTSLRVGEGFADTLTLQHTPKGSALYSQACFYLPGVNISLATNNFDVAFTYNWAFLFIRGTERASTSTDLNNVKVSVDNAKLCTVIKTDIVNKSPRFTVLSISYPQVNNFKVVTPVSSKTKVEYHTLGIQIVAAVLKFFGVADIEKIIAGKIEDELQKQFDSQIKVSSSGLKDGSLFKPFLPEAINQKLTTNIVNAYKKAISVQFDSQPLKFRENGEKYCKQLVNSQLTGKSFPLQPGVIEQFCKEIYLDVSVIPFDANPAFEKLGCYSYAYSPLSYAAQGKNTWWQKSCGITTTVSVSIEGELKPIINCVQNFQNDVLSAANANACVNLVLSEILNLSPNLIKQILSQNLRSLADIKKAAAASGAPLSVQNRLSQFLK